ncbi:MAG: hypothetical protein LBB74_00280 [Chitinispirillales bacterium]|jgi:tRNA A37 methylthiotransferase MiaB|nr:hypothetical protein [Chitinispirillales bacterium]
MLKSKPKRFFNVAGPCVPGKHYMLDPLRGIGGELMNLIDDEQYFVLHAARQSGKTTLLKQLTRDINAGGEYRAMYSRWRRCRSGPSRSGGFRR